MQFRILHYKSFVPLVEISEYQHMWSFFGRSHNYNLFIGLVEFLIGALIIFRRTRLIALLLSVGVCLNILILNIEFDVHFAIQHISFDLFITLVLLFQYRKDLFKFFIKNGGKLRKRGSFTNSGLLKKLPYVYLVVLSVGYLIFAYHIRSEVNEEIVGSYKIENIHLRNSQLELEKGKIGSSPMIFFEYNHQAVLSLNDSIYFGNYSVEKENIRIYLNTSEDLKLKFIYGRLNENGTLQGMANDSIPITMKITRLSGEEDYLNELYTD